MDDLDPVLFWDASHPLSPFYPAPIVLDGRTYATVEHYYQASKFEPGSPIFDLVAHAPTPSDAKRLARESGDLRRGDWADVKEHVMYFATLAKYAQHSALRAHLLATGTRELVENSPDDAYWGRPPGGGKNRMGVILMAVRSNLAPRRPI